MRVDRVERIHRAPARGMCWLMLAACVSCASQEADTRADKDFCKGVHLDATGAPRLTVELAPFAGRLAEETGVYVLDGGTEAMLTRAWLSEAAERTIDAQYFIFSADNIGKIATDYLLRAAERGVRVRVIVDDILLDAAALDLLALDAHENLSIKIYNPNVNIGKSIGDKIANAVTDFRGINQRMHNKTFIVDGAAVITGGRNIADEYFDYDHEYNFRDRDVLLIGVAASDAQRSFEQFWNDPLSVEVAALLENEEKADLKTASHALHEYACDPKNFWPEVREKIRDLPQAFDTIQGSGKLQWVRDVAFISDAPGKNAGDQGLGGGGITTDALRGLLAQARRQVVIQSPYVVTTAATHALFARAVRRGVAVKILTNSLASTDNLEAFSGYQRDRQALLATGVEIYEWRPDAALRRSLMRSALTERIAQPPIFALHAKTMVIDGERLVVGTFNLDPRSANLNTECITVIPSRALAADVLSRMHQEMRTGNAWRVTKSSNPDAHAGWWKRFRAFVRRLVPKSVL